jgi:DNA repair exonuclease SbcCD ATPase subunit
MSDFDPADFVDDDFQTQKTASSNSTPSSSAAFRAPTREDVDNKVADAQQRLAELKRAQEELERERASLEETRRRQMEFQTGRQEMVHNLTRGLGLLEEAEFTARRDAEQMAKTLADFRERLSKVESIREETWTKDNFNVELTRALTAIENARMEWNAGLLKFPVLSGSAPNSAAASPETNATTKFGIENLSFGQLCKLGLAFTWPLAVVALGALAILVVVLLRH